MSDKNEFEKNSERPQQYYFEGYYDSAFSMPADADKNHSFTIQHDSAPPAFPPQEDKKEKQSGLRKHKRVFIIAAVVLIVAICFALLAQFAMTHVVTVTREDGKLSITLSRKTRSKPAFPGVTDEVTQTPAPTDGQGHSIWPAPDSSVWTGLALGLSSRGASETPMEMTDVFKRVSASVVAVVATGENGAMLGSGVIISEDGYIITSEHIVSSAYSIAVLVRGTTEYEALLVGLDETTDLAVLKIDGSGLQKAVLGNPADLEIGEKVIAIGCPLGTTLTMTEGIVSSLSTTMKYYGYKMDMIQNTATIGDGNSGGALVDMYGRVVGITNMKVSAAVSALDGLNISIPMNVVKPVVDELLYHGYVEGRPSLGFETMDVPRSVATYYGVPLGAYISSVKKGSDAYFKGLVEGNIIVSLEGYEVKGTDSLNELKNAYKAGDTVRLGVYSMDIGYFYIDVVIGDSAAGSST